MDNLVPPAQTTPPRPRGGRGRGGGSRTPRGGSTQAGGPAGPDRGRRGGRGRGRGRGGHPNERADRPGQPEPNAPRPPASPGGGIFGDRLTDDAQKTEGETRGKEAVQNADEEDDGEVCFICASPVIHQAVAPCNHRTCHICALRLRALYKTKACAHCRTLSDFVIFTDEPEKRYEQFQDSDFSSVDNNLGIKYEKADIFEDTVLLLRYNCPDEECDVACLGWPDLHRHVRSVHHKWMCDLCTRNKKVFTHEHELFTQNELKKHEKFGDDNPGAVDQTGFKGHPECGFCRQRFYGDDELYTHCRDRHEKCHICDRRDQGRNPQYYLNYDSLEMHFRKEHFLCPDQECLEKKFVVFESEMDLKAHQIESHPNGLTKDALRDARRVDLRGFGDVHERYQPQRGGRREGQGRGRGRGRDPNSEPLPQSSAQPLRRDELAYQRQMAIQSAQSVTPRTFGGQLSAPSTEAYAARPPNQAPPSVRAPTSGPADTFPSLSSLQSSLEGSSPRPTSPVNEATLSPQEQARRVRHATVIERANSMLRNDQSKMAEFRTKVSSFRNSSITAVSLVEDFITLFDRPTAEIGTLVNELAEIFEISSKRDDLLRAWKDWKAINEDYPSLPGSGSTSTPSAGSSHGGRRVLKLKTSTAQSARSAVSRTGSWGSANSTVFPALPAPVNRSSAGRGSTTPWAGATAAGKAPVAPSRPTRPAASASSSGGLAADAFPALPAAPKPKSTVFSPGYTGNGVRRPNAAPTTSNPWGAGNAGGSSSAGPEVDSEAQSDQKKRGNKNKKQTLIHFG